MHLSTFLFPRICSSGLQEELSFKTRNRATGIFPAQKKAYGESREQSITTLGFLRIWRRSRECVDNFELLHVPREGHFLYISAVEVWHAVWECQNLLFIYDILKYPTLQMDHWIDPNSDHRVCCAAKRRRFRLDYFKSCSKLYVPDF